MQSGITIFWHAWGYSGNTWFTQLKNFGFSRNVGVSKKNLLLVFLKNSRVGRISRQFVELAFFLLREKSIKSNVESFCLTLLKNFVGRTFSFPFEIWTFLGKPVKPFEKFVYCVIKLDRFEDRTQGEAEARQRMLSEKTKWSKITNFEKFVFKKPEAEKNLSRSWHF